MTVKLSSGLQVKGGAVLCAAVFFLMGGETSPSVLDDVE